MNAFRAHELEPTFNVDDRPQPADHVAGLRVPTVVIMLSVIGLLISGQLDLPRSGRWADGGTIQHLRRPLAARSRTTGNLLMLL